MRSALEIFYKHQVAIHDMPEVREAILADDDHGALDSLVAEHGLDLSEAAVVLEYLEPRLKGVPVDFVEIAVGDIYWPTAEECRDVDDIDPFERGQRYYARRGHIVGEMVTTTSFEPDGSELNRVFFGGDRIEAEKLDQVWKLVPRPV